ncbi:MAG: hypothetical protein OXE75_04350, partial [bacterium]|nr:hypothetical protein [bacterium]
LREFAMPTEFREAESHGVSARVFLDGVDSGSTFRADFANDLGEPAMSHVVLPSYQVSSRRPCALRSAR